MDTPAERFAALVNADDADTHLDMLCALTSKAIDPTVDVGGILGALDTLADGTPNTFDGIMETLFSAGLLSGDLDDYHDPRNSLIHEVLTRRKGMPITLSVIAMEVGKRLGVPIAGIGMPGHFVVRDVAAGTYADPFAGGVRYDEQAMIESWKQRMGEDAPFRRSMLAATPAREIMLRILNNLKHSLVSRDQSVLLARLVPLRAAFSELAAEADQHRQWMRHFN